MSPWQKLLETPNPHGHLIQLYAADEGGLITNVTRYLAEGLKRGDGVLVISSAEHCALFRQKLRDSGVDLEAAEQQERWAFCDANVLLSQFMIGGQPDWHRFEAEVGAAMGRVRRVSDRGGLRAYGEMVGILWNARQFSAAIRLEQFWNKLLGRSSFSLYCAYGIDVFGKEFQIAALDELLCAHTHLVPAETSGHLESAINQAMEEVLGPEVHSLKLLIKANYRPAWAVLPSGEAIVLWLRNNLPDQADKILALARKHYVTRLQSGLGATQ